jgi:transcriptional regulator with XRE-family HTH domain
MMGQELRKARQRAGLTQERLSFLAGLSRPYISELERNLKSPTVDTLFRIGSATRSRSRRRTSSGGWMPWGSGSRVRDEVKKAERVQHVWEPALWSIGTGWRHHINDDPVNPGGGVVCDEWLWHVFDMMLLS